VGRSVTQSSLTGDCLQNARVPSPEDLVPWYQARSRSLARRSRRRCPTNATPWGGGTGLVTRRWSGSRTCSWQGYKSRSQQRGRRCACSRSPGCCPRRFGDGLLRVGGIMLFVLCLPRGEQPSGNRRVQQREGCDMKNRTASAWRAPPSRNAAFPTDSLFAAAQKMRVTKNVRRPCVGFQCAKKK